MANELIFIFKRQDIQKLLDQNTNYIVVKSFIEEGVLQTKEKVGVVRVKAEAVEQGNPDPLATVYGCPNPPCDTEGD